jgi:hypothetical protein
LPLSEYVCCKPKIKNGAPPSLVDLAPFVLVLR